MENYMNASLYIIENVCDDKQVIWVALEQLMIIFMQLPPSSFFLSAQQCLQLEQSLHAVLFQASDK